MKNRWKLLCLALLTFGLLYFYKQHYITAEEILSWQPEDLLLAGVILLIGYAVKSTLVFVPIMPLQILVGHIYSREYAILINLLGQIVVLSVPYWIGKQLGAKKIDMLIVKYPKLEAVLRVQQDNEMAMCFMLRACSVPPVDIVTMYLGACGTSFHTNVIGGVLGQFPGMILTTFLGANIRNPESPAFWKALILNVLRVILSGLGFFLYKQLSSKEANR